jgi:hypothetical protein
MTREKEIEHYFVKQVKKAGGKAYKWVSPGNLGVPDRIVFFPQRVVILVELKAPGKTLSKSQIKRHEELERFSFWPHILVSKEAVNDFISNNTD